MSTQVSDDSSSVLRPLALPESFAFEIGLQVVDDGGNVTDDPFLDRKALQVLDVRREPGAVPTTARPLDSDPLPSVNLTTSTARRHSEGGQE